MLRNCEIQAIACNSNIPVMAQSNDATIANNVKMSFSDKLKLLCKLKGSIHFEKVLTASSAYSNNLHGPSTLALPAWFVQEHGDKFRKHVILRTEASAKAWSVTLTVFHKSPTVRQVKFAGGWKPFATFHGLIIGDSLIFSLTALSEFEVYIFPGTGNLTKALPSQLAPKNWPNNSRFSRKKAKQAHESKSEKSPVEESIEDAVKLSTWNTEKETIVDLRTISAFGHNPTATSLRNSSDSKDWHLVELDVIDSSSRDHHNSNNGQELGPALDHDELIVQSGVTEDVAPQHIGGRKDAENKNQGFTLHKIPMNFPLSAGFLKQLTISNFYCREGTEGGGRTACIEVPVVFWRTYGSRLHSLVKLQGIREESQVRTVACLPILQGDQTWRLYFRAGWRDFAEANNLQVGQILEFTLTAKSYFVVRGANS